MSGGSYRHDDVTKVEVAKATLGGMIQAELFDTSITVTFLYDDDAFARAYQESLVPRIDQIRTTYPDYVAAPTVDDSANQLVLIGAFDGI